MGANKKLMGQLDHWSLWSFYYLDFDFEQRNAWEKELPKLKKNLSGEFPGCLLWAAACEEALLEPGDVHAASAGGHSLGGANNILKAEEGRTLRLKWEEKPTPAVNVQLMARVDLS